MGGNFKNITLAALYGECEKERSLYIFKFTVTVLVTFEPSIATHEIVNTVADVSGTVLAPPARCVSEKLPSGLETRHDFTPFEPQ